VGAAVIQLCFPFSSGEPVQERPSRTTLYWRRKLVKTAAYAFELGRRRARQPKPHTLSAAAMAPSPVWLSRDDRSELVSLAKRIDRLSISRVDPEAFFVARSELADKLRRIARRQR
jgi:hypothetical protein